MDANPYARSSNLDLLRWLHGGHRRLSDKLRNVLNWSALSLFATGGKHLSENTARNIEQRLNLPGRWLDRDNREMLTLSEDDFETVMVLLSAAPDVKSAVRTLLTRR
jgi:hypothetical protein